MDVVTVSLIIGNVLSYLCHAAHFKARSRCNIGNAACCCQVSGEMEQEMEQEATVSTPHPADVENKTQSC